MTSVIREVSFSKKRTCLTFGMDFNSWLVFMVDIYGKYFTQSELLGYGEDNNFLVGRS